MRRLVDERNHLSRLAALILLAWIVMTYFYMRFNGISEFQIFSGWMLLLTQSGTDIIISMISLKLMKQADLQYKKIFCLMFVAFFVEAFTDGNLNTTIYILNLYPLSDFSEFSIEAPFLVFQLLLFTTYIKILKISKFSIRGKDAYSLSAMLPFFFILFAVLYFFIFSYKWTIEAFSQSGIIQIFSVLIDIMNFIMAIICIAASSSLPILYISTGVLILVTTDVTERFSILNTTYLSNSLLQMMWTLGLLVILFGMISIKNKIKNTKGVLNLLSIRSIQVQYTLWGFIVSVFSLGAFIIIFEIFSGHVSYHNVLVKSASSGLIIFSAISVLASKFLASKMSEPFHQIKNLLGVVTNRESIEVSSAEQYILSYSNRGADEFRELSDFMIQSFHIKKEKILLENKLAESALRVAHDIRSPLITLNMMLCNINTIQEDQRIIIRRSIQRITDIANNLLTNYRKENENVNLATMSQEPIVLMLDGVISEKRVQFDDEKININLIVNDQSIFSFVYVNESEFKRTISNIINNAVDALDTDNGGNVCVYVDNIGGKIQIKVEDDGCGIPRHMLNLIMEAGVTYGKNNGSGLGLTYAVDKIRSWKGGYFIKSEVGYGTCFTIIIPESMPADWFRESLEFKRGTKIIILDDDEYIHEIWNKKLNYFVTQGYVSIEQFYSIDDMCNFIVTDNCDSKIFLLDYEIIGSDENGLSIAMKLNISKITTLVTSRYDDLELRKQCLNEGVKIIPKYFAAKLPITIID